MGLRAKRTYLLWLGQVPLEEQVEKTLTKIAVFIEEQRLTYPEPTIAFVETANRT